MEFLKRAWAEIHLDRLKANAENYRKYLRPGTELMCVVKANCYGHGSVACSKYLQEELTVKNFAVSNLNEAIELREGGIDGEILILGYTPPECAGLLSEYGIIQAVTEYDYAEALSDFSTSPVRCHIKLDTGMSRIGLRFETASEYADEILRISNLPNIETEGIFTHLCVADSETDENREYTRKQISLIKSVKAELLSRDFKLSHCHFLNSAGGIFYSDEASSLARLGIILYGLTPDTSLTLPFELAPVMELKAVVSQVKTVEKGVFVSYGRTFETTGTTKIATVSAGYADGVPRLLSNKGEVLVKGKRTKIIGRVCMDQFMIDVTGIDVKSGDTVTIFGKSGKEKITADDIADICGTIGYEIVCGITKRVPRIYFNKGKPV